MADSPRLGLFEGYGVELEYMIVDRRSLAVRPLVDRVLADAAGSLVADFYNGAIAWSNELVNHVLELKTNGPVASLDGLSEHFHRNVLEVNDLLAPYDAMLLATGSHPFMDPQIDTHLWPHESGEIYELYDRLFDCRGHGWSNLQSIHLNLPFRSDAEFERLHAAVRVLLPLLPALSASSPLLDGRLTGWADSRLESYRHNQERFPSIAGKIIPEAAFSERDYERLIFAAIRRDVAPYDPEGLLHHYFLNSRGAIARFDRGTIEIRIIDTQESPLADLSLIAFFVAALQHLVSETWCSLDQQKRWSEDDLFSIFLDVIRSAEHTVVESAAYIRLFGLTDEVLTAGDLWRGLFDQIGSELPKTHRGPVERILHSGSLSTRIRRALPPEFAPDDLRAVYADLAACLRENRLFLQRA